MHLVAKFQERQYRQRLEKETQRVNQRLQLPVELLEQVLANVKDRSILATLCRVSKTFISVAAPVLYRTIELKLDQELDLQSIKLHKTVSYQHLSGSILELDLTLAFRASGRVEKTALRGYRRMEKIAGEIAIGLLNLEVLKVHCTVTSSEHIVTLDFLARLSTRRLRKLYVTCHSKAAEIDLCGIFSAPCLQSVTLLGWFCRPPPTKRPSDEFWADKKIMSNLTGLCTFWESGITEIACARRMKRLDFRSFNEQVALQVRRHAANITHLNIESWDQRDTCRSFLKEISPQLSRVRFFGILSLPQHSAEERFEDLQTLECIARTLAFLRINTLHTSDHTWLKALLPRIELLFPKLRIILLNDGGLIRRSAGDWIDSKEVEFKPGGWQILEDGLESMLQ